MRAGGDQPDVAALLEEAARERCGDGDRVLLRRIEPGLGRPLTAVIRGPVHRSRGGSVRHVMKVEDDPDVGGWILIELLVRSEEHTSELQSPSNTVCRLPLEKKKKYITSS